MMPNKKRYWVVYVKNGKPKTISFLLLIEAKLFSVEFLYKHKYSDPNNYIFGVIYGEPEHRGKYWSKTPKETA